MANFSAAFGYDLYLIPLLSTSVDVTFAGVTGGIGVGAGNFIDTTTTVAANEKVTYSGGVFSLGATPVAEPTDGTMQPVRLSGLTSASLETDTGSEDIYTYDDETDGFNQAVATTKSWSMSLAGVADFKDAGYQILRLTEQNTVADSLRVKIGRVGPTGTVETVYGYGTLMGYTESNEVSSIVSWECNLMGYGKYVAELDENAGNQLIGGIATTDTYNTTTPFTVTDSSGIAVTLSGGSGASADAEVTTVAGNLTAVAITVAGTNYQVGDIITVNEDAGSGVATFRVATVV